MITMEQALTAQRFHRNGCKRTVGPRGGVTTAVEEWRRNGATKTWKTRPGEFRIPVKWGMRSYDYITQREADRFHTEADCPLSRIVEWDGTPDPFIVNIECPNHHQTDFRLEAGEEVPAWCPQCGAPYEDE